jgi:hypothetical protein
MFLRIAILLLAVLLSAPLTAADKAPTYRLDYLIGFDPKAGEASVTLTVTPRSGRLQRLRFSIDPERHRAVDADGRLSRDGNRYTWRPPEEGAGSLRFRYKVDRQRGSGAYDARITDSWALLRADRLIPPAAALAPGKARAEATLRFVLPKGWTNQEIGYLYRAAVKGFVVHNPGRRFQQPLGWMIAGEVGTRREFIDGMEVVVAAPKGEEMRRNDLIAALNVAAVEARAAFGHLPQKLLIVGAGDPMWRGGLSGPNSMYLHAERPLIGENGTSPLLHELVHVVTRIRGAKGQDWIAEGFAEYYSVALLRRSRLVTDERADKALELMRRQAEGVRRLSATASSGPRTGRAVLLLVELDAEIREASKDEKNLDDVTRQLVGKGRISLAQLKAAAEKVLGRPSKTLQTPLLIDG